MLRFCSYFNLSLVQYVSELFQEARMNLLKRVGFFLFFSFIWLFLFNNISFAAVSNNQKQIEVRVEMSPSSAPFAGFIATLDENKNVNIKRFTDPALFAQMLNMRVDEVVSGNLSSMESTDMVSAQAPDSHEAEFSVLTTSQARANSYNLVEDVVWIDMNWLESHHPFNYDGTNVTWDNLYGSAWHRRGTGWYLTWLSFGGRNRTLPSSYDYRRAYASFQNDVFPGGPYKNAITTYTYVYGNGSISANHTFYLDPKGVSLGWRWSGWHTRDQL